MGNSSTEVSVPLVPVAEVRPAIKIDKGVPIPAADRTGRTKWPIRKLAKDESFAVPAGSDPSAMRTRIQLAANYQARTNGGKFAVRLLEENGVRVVRVWRVA